ncbi:uncharacterized protein DNG_00053 [Cephalotrichum gorgonifer]|uniref:Uncharacterized protein n=1 Tax=Cephalotrichum gorgonifer TaxID=2041049 RepID=A0AAE8MPM5_9PEZI|nr:uncharacterized protein DNG_00053 [Cephalotrichum gorgonifer]
MNTTPDINSADASPSAGIPADNTPQGEQPAKDSHGKQENGSQVERSLRQATEVMKILFHDVEQMKIHLDTKDGEVKKLQEQVADLKKLQQQAAEAMKLGRQVATMDNQIQLGYLKLKVMKSQADTKEEENKKLRERVAKMDERICQLEARMDTATPDEVVVYTLSFGFETVLPFIWPAILDLGRHEVRVGWRVSSWGRGRV